MNFPNSKHPENFSLPKHPHLSLHRAFTDLQKHCSGFLQHMSDHPLFNPNPSFLKTHLESTLSNLGNQAKQAFNTGISSFGSGYYHSKNPVWARIPQRNETQFEAAQQFGSTMTVEAIEERLAGVPVYALSNDAGEFVLVSGVQTGKSLGLLYFKKEDAEAFLEQMKLMDSGMRRASKVVLVALNKVVFQLKVDGVAFRLVPESSQIKNALKRISYFGAPKAILMFCMQIYHLRDTNSLLKTFYLLFGCEERQKAGFSDEGFSGVPVFQSRSLIFKSQNIRYRPVFFRKEDLENSLLRASRQENRLNPAFRQGDIQVAVLEDIIKGMKGSSASNWDDVVFIPPGFDVSTDPSQQ